MRSFLRLVDVCESQPGSSKKDVTKSKINQPLSRSLSNHGRLDFVNLPIRHGLFTTLAL